MLLASQKTPFFDIVIAHDAPAAVRYAAEELQRYVERICLAFPAIHTDRQTPGPKSILVGDSARRAELFPGVSAGDLRRGRGESYVLRTRGGHLLVMGGSPRGTLYAVYDLLERFGVRWWMPWDQDVPRRTRLAIEDLNVRFDPPLIYRATW